MNMYRRMSCWAGYLTVWMLLSGAFTWATSPPVVDESLIPTMDKINKRSLVPPTFPLNDAQLFYSVPRVPTPLLKNYALYWNKLTPLMKELKNLEGLAKQSEGSETIPISIQLLASQLAWLELGYQQVAPTITEDEKHYYSWQLVNRVMDNLQSFHRLWVAQTTLGGNKRPSAVAMEEEEAFLRTKWLAAKASMLELLELQALCQLLLAPPPTQRG